MIQAMPKAAFDLAQCSHIQGSLVSSSSVREATRGWSKNHGFKLGQEEETNTVVAAHGYFARLIVQYVSFMISHSLHLLLAAWPLLGIWFTAQAASATAFNLDGFNIKQSILEGQGCLVNIWADVPNRAGLGMAVMLEPNVLNVPLDLAAAEATPVALSATSIVLGLTAQ